MSSVFGRLNFSSISGVEVSNLSSNTASTLEQLPSFMNDWQTTDVANSDTSGYYKNPVSANITSIWGVSNSIISIAGINQANANVISDAANNLYESANNFMNHTDRISGVVPVNANTTLLPHYNTAVAVGKMVIYLTNKSDGIQNNAPIIGNFSSLFTSANLTSYYSTISSYPQTIINSIGIDPLDSSYTCNLTPTQINTIANNINAVATFMNTKLTSDVNFYNTCQAIVDDYNIVKQFSNMGDSEIYLVENLVGSNKLLSRLNS